MDNVLIGNNTLRINRNISRERSSSNLSFNEKFRSGFRSGINVSNTAVQNILRPIPGSAVLSSSLSNAAASLGGSGSMLGGGDFSNSAAASIGGIGEGNVGSLQDEMVRNNSDLIAKQMKVSQIATGHTLESNLIKTMTDTLKAIVNNIR